MNRNDLTVVIAAALFGSAVTYLGTSLYQLRKSSKNLEARLDALKKLREDMEIDPESMSTADILGYLDRLFNIQNMPS